MTEEQMNNIDKPELVDWPPTSDEAIKCINRLLDSDEVQDDDYADAMVVKAFMVSVIDEMAAISTSHNSLHDRYANALATIESLERQLLAAHDNR